MEDLKQTGVSAALSAAEAVTGVMERLARLFYFWGCDPSVFVPVEEIPESSIGEIEEATGELESLSVPYGLGTETSAGNVPGEEAFRDVVRSKVLRLQKASPMLLKH